MEIHPHLGLGEIRLGSSREAALTLLGEPDRREKFSFLDDETTEYFEYDDLELELGYSTDDGDQLGVIRCGSHTLTLDGKPIIGLPLDEFLESHSGFQIEEDEEGEDEDDFLESHPDYIHPEKDLSVTILENLVTSVSIFPAWNEDDTPRWPVEGP